MGYGKRALRLLKNYYEGKFTSLDETVANLEEDGIETIDDEEVDLLRENIAPRKKVPTLLKRLTERPPEVLDYLGTSFGLTNDLLRFWKSQKFVPVYLSQKENDLTGEHSCILLTPIAQSERTTSHEWLTAYFTDFRRRILKLFGKSFNKFTTGLALSLLDNRNVKVSDTPLNQSVIDAHFLPHDVQRLEAYIKNQVEYRLVLDLILDLGLLYFQSKMGGVNIDNLQKAILLGFGLQNKTLDQLADEFNMPASQVLAKFYDCMKKLTTHILSTMERNIESAMVDEAQLDTGKSFVALPTTMTDELEVAAKKLEKLQKKELKKLKKENLEQYAIKGTEADWQKALTTKSKTSVISVTRFGE
jgi:N-acetyltransferase 10